MLHKCHFPPAFVTALSYPFLSLSCLITSRVPFPFLLFPSSSLPSLSHLFTAFSFPPLHSFIIPLSPPLSSLYPCPFSSSPHLSLHSLLPFPFLSCPTPQPLLFHFPLFFLLFPFPSVSSTSLFVPFLFCRCFPAPPTSPVRFTPPQSVLPALSSHSPYLPASPSPSTSHCFFPRPSTLYSPTYSTSSLTL